MWFTAALLLSISLWPLWPVAVSRQDDEPAPGLEIINLDVSIKHDSGARDQDGTRSDTDSSVGVDIRRGTRQTDRNETGPPGDVSRPGRDRQDQWDRTGDDSWAQTMRKPRYSYVATLRVGNTGTKKIKAVTWDLVIFDSQEHKELRRFTYRNKKTIAPGKDATLVHEVQPSEADRKAVITRIDYADGSRWERRPVVK